jgi:hypothetical protein
MFALMGLFDGTVIDLDPDAKDPGPGPTLGARITVAQINKIAFNECFICYGMLFGHVRATGCVDLRGLARGAIAV